MDDIQIYIRNELQRLRIHCRNFGPWGLNEYESQLLELHLAWNVSSIESIIHNFLKTLCAETENKVRIQFLPSVKSIKSESSKTDFIPFEGRPFALLSALLNQVEAEMPQTKYREDLKNIKSLFNRYKTISVRQLGLLAMHTNNFYIGDPALLNELKIEQIFEDSKTGGLSVHKKLRQLLKKK
ncbi:hypothetical protein [Bdellovibrio reynosensis]|uniref:Uncharacterized protein n=1 Tax=Bdellovibrio reynosensis TaxID=2835041 RepID=A0ABY4CH44_9BACT|nr:hypothetical protein [Bdellovibrio reynosensis]UOF02893.1 hypothetical protein MNR06_07995 [Bdellovibrio reynosensis]